MNCIFSCHLNNRPTEGRSCLSPRGQSMLLVYCACRIPALLVLLLWRPLIGVPESHRLDLMTPG